MKQTAPSITPTETRKNGCIYLDYAASSPCDSRVVDKIVSVISEVGNPHARHHTAGAKASLILKNARGQVAEAIGATTNEVVFTSGATESNNLVLKGLRNHLLSTGKVHIITGAVEHKSVLYPVKWLEEMGFETTIVPPKPCGMIEADMVLKAIRPNTGLLSIQAVNNEVGVIQPLDEISSILQSRDIIFHTDAAQALSKIPVNVQAWGVDFASFSAHKTYGPAGVGALFVRASCKNLLEPLNHGGGQEDGLRAGTVPVALCAGFGVAGTLIEDDRNRIQSLRERLLTRFEFLHPIVYGHSDPQWNVPGILNIRFPGVDAETLVMALPDLAFGQGSACSSTGANNLSHVMEAITGSKEAALESIRLSFGRFTTEADIDEAASMIVDTVNGVKSAL